MNVFAQIGGILKGRAGKPTARTAAVDLYESIVHAARDPSLYEKGGVPDTVDGRFDSVALHAFILMDRMAGVDGWEDVGSALADRMVADMDQSLREIGIGDMSIGKKVKAAASQLYGRFDVYWGALKSDDPDNALTEALSRNLFRNADPSPESLHQIAKYVMRQRTYMVQIPNEEILVGRLRFQPATEILSMEGSGT